jgi:hypothetical protein
VARSLLSYRWSEPHEQWTFDSRCNPDPVCIEAIAAYAHTNVLSLPSIRNTVREARVLARERNSALVNARDVKQALESRQRADVAIRASFNSKSKGGYRPKTEPRQAYIDAPPASQDRPDLQEQISNFPRKWR